MPEKKGSLSAQSMAARQRRKRISENMQELGRLVPGGNKMNTAEMFQAAFKYVKYLQAQVGILELTASLLHHHREQHVGASKEEAASGARNHHLLQIWIYDLYSEIGHITRQQQQGSLPLISLKFITAVYKPILTLRVVGADSLLLGICSCSSPSPYEHVLSWHLLISLHT